jgi:hypothetical protein
MPIFSVTLYGSREQQVNYTAVVEVEAENTDEAGDKAARATLVWHKDDDQPEIAGTITSRTMDGKLVHQIDQLGEKLAEDYDEDEDEDD